MKVVAIVQTRVGSSRLQGKVLMKIQGKSILNHVLTRLSKCREIDEIVVATTNLEKDKAIIDEIKYLNVSYFRGSEEDVLSRFHGAATKYKATVIIRITSDCPLLDPKLIDNMVRFYKNHSYDMVSNANNNEEERTYPRGLDVEIFPYRLLDKANLEAHKKYEREHVTPYFYENNFNIYNYKNNIDYSNFRWTLDTYEDFKFIEKIYEELYKGNHDFYMMEIIKLLREKPEIININQDVLQKKVRDINYDIYLKKAEIEDCNEVFNWINHREVRENSFNSEEIDLDSHIKWFKEKINNPNTRFYIIMSDNKRLGEIRVDIEKGIGYISYLVSKEYRNLGIGSTALKLIGDYVKDVPLVGRVKKENIASIKAFEKACYIKLLKEDFFEFFYEEK